MAIQDSDSVKGGLLAAWVTTIVRRAVWVAAAAILLTIAAFKYTADNLAIDTDTTNMIAADVPFRRQSDDFDRAFPQLDDLLVVVVDAGSSERAQDAAASIAERLRASAYVTNVYHPGAADFFRRNGLLYLDPETLARTLDRLAYAQPFLATLAREPTLNGLLQAIGEALEHAEEADRSDLAAMLARIAAVAEAVRDGRPGSLSWRALMTVAGAPQPGTRQFVIARPRLDYASLKPAAAAIDAVRGATAALGFGGQSGVRVRLTGPAALDQEELESAALGGKSAALLSLALVTILLAVGLRSFRLVLATVATLLIGLVWSAAFATVAIGHLNLISVAFAVLFVGLGVDFSIHFCLRYREALATEDNGKAALAAAAVGVGRPLTISAVFAAIGFYAFLPTDYLGFAELGLIAGTSMFIALFTNLTVLPALLALAPGRRLAALPVRDLWAAMALGLDRHGSAIRRAALALAVAAALALPWLRFDFNPLNLKDPGSESVATFQDLASAEDSGVYAINLLADDVAAAASVAERLAGLDTVSRAITLSSFVPEGQAEKLALIEDASLFLAPVLYPRAQREPPSAAERQAALDAFQARLARAAREDGPLARNAARLQAALTALPGAPAQAGAGLRELERRLTEFLPKQLEDIRLALGAEAVTLVDLPDSLRSRWVAADGRVRVQILPEGDVSANEAMRRFVDSVLRVDSRATGGPVIIAEASDAVLKAFVEATLLAFVAIAVLLAVLHRNVGLVLLALAPLLLAALLTLATSAALGLAFNFANVIVLPLLFGLGVSSAIHLLERWRHVADSRALMITSTPRAVLFSTLTTVASFGSLAISAHRGMASMGQLLTIAILFTLITTLLVLPSLMAWAGARSR